VDILPVAGEMTSNLLSVWTSTPLMIRGMGFLLSFTTAMVMLKGYAKHS
jgi:hypothetical protein